MRPRPAVRHVPGLGTVKLLAESKTDFLPPGIYNLDFHVTTAGGGRHRVRGVRFEVAPKAAPRGGGQIRRPAKRSKRR